MKFLALVMLVMTPALNASMSTWEKLEPMPMPLAGQVCGEAGGKLILVGGTNWDTAPVKNWVKTVYVFDPVTLHWSLIGSMDEPYAYGIGATVDRTFVVVAGTTGRTPFAGVIKVAGAAVSWTDTGGVTVPAVLSAGGQIGDEIVAVGGTDDAANIAGFTNNAHAWNSRTGELRSLPKPPRSGFGIAASAVIWGNLYIFGGATWNGDTKWVDNSTEAWAFSMQLNTWRKLTPLPHAVRGASAVVLDDHHIYLGGGYGDKGFTDEAVIYDVTADRYQPALPLPYPALTHLVKCGNYVYCFGGEDGQKHRSNGAYRIRTTALLTTK